MAAREAPGPRPAAWGIAAAEAAADEVVRRVRPTEASERRRAEVVDYARRLVGAALGSEVFAYGSVPLKTYLPDGDIDLTILGNTSHDSTLVNDVYCILDSEEQNSDAEFEVKDLDRINAEVRLIKCTIGNIIVDISFNQTGGICALCFLELVDRKVGKDHLLKRSIILIKAWCYYESRLLGAHHGLISTYALEILILYIFNLFHKSLHGPLEVLYRFLEYFSEFDWDSYCISLNGPVALSSLPNLIVEATGIHTDDLLFDKGFLKSSMAEVIVPPRDSGQSGACYTRFRPKHLNIIDPLKECNNLGRSVNRASFHRIRTAFSYGARKLGQILILQSELIPNEIYGFFKNTLGRNGRGFRPDVASTGASHPSFGTGKDILEEISTMSISYRKGDENSTPHGLSKSLDDNGTHVTNGSARSCSCLPGGHNAASRTDLSSSRFVHHGLKQHSLFYQENGNGLDQLSYCPAKTFGLNHRSLTQSQVHVNNQLPTLNSYADVNNLTTDRKSWIAVHVEKQQLPPLSLRLPDLSGDMDLQFRCLRQVQYHLEYLFDAFLQSVQEEFSDGKFQKSPFHFPSRNILSDAEAAWPGLQLSSSVESNGRKLSPVSCSHSTEAVSQHSQDEDPWDVACQQNISLPYATEIPSNGLSPSSSYADSDSSVLWCCSSEGSPEMNGTDMSIPKRNYDTYKEQVLGPSIESGQILTNRSVPIETNPSSATEGSFVHYHEQVARPSRNKEMTIGQSVKVQGYIHSDRQAVEKHSCDPKKEFTRYGDKTRQIPKYHGDICLNMKVLQNQQYATDVEFVPTPNAMRQTPKNQPFNRIQTASKDCTSASLSRNLPSKQSYGTRKEDEILDWQTRPRYGPLNLQNQQCGRAWSKYSAGKQSCNNHKEHLSIIAGTQHRPCNGAANILNGIEREVNSLKFDENGNQPWPMLQEAPLSLRNINSQGRAPVSNTPLPSFPITNGPPLETIEFGSLGPFALALSSPSKKVANTHPGRKVLADASASVVQRSRADSRHSRSPEFCKVGNEDEFPPLNAGVR